MWDVLEWAAAASHLVIFVGIVAIFAVLIFILSVVVDQRDGLRKEVADLRESQKRFLSSGAEYAEKTQWKRQKLMNGAEFKLFKKLDDMVAQMNATGRPDRPLRLSTQVSYGEFLDVPGRGHKNWGRNAKTAYFALARKRADFLIIDWTGLPVAVIEYQGSGHYRNGCGSGNSAYRRDQAKVIACHRAGVPFVEVAPDGMTAGQRRDVLSILSSSKSQLAA